MKQKLKLFLTIFTFTQISLSASLADIESFWLTTENKKVTIASTVGSTYSLIAMVYTGCAHACPLTIAKMQKILKDFKAKNVTDVQVILSSFDVKSDRPDKLKKYQADKKLDVKKWHFLAAESEADARELAVTLGISYKDLGDGDFSHSNLITLLGPGGEVLSSIDNLNADSDKLVEALQAHRKLKK